MKLRFLGFVTLAAACGGPGANSPDRSTLAEKWLTRAKQSYRSGDTDDASASIGSALEAAPHDTETHLVAARIALSRLDYPRALAMSEGLTTSEAHSIRGRAYWYAGDIEHAADELEEMLADPTVKDPWARDVAKLARRGQGRHPFEMEGAVVASVEMPQAGPALIVPCELEGERVLALVSTAMGEFMVDSGMRREPAWVNLKFGDHLEVKDVPALTYDLSAVSRQLGAPIKALIGINALRHMHITFDRRGSQFVVRRSEPAAPPDASRIPVFYVRGGGMMIPAAVSNREDGKAPLFVDSAAFYPLALDDGLLKRSGADLSSFRSAAGAPPNTRLGNLPFFRLGSLNLPDVPVMQGATLGEVKQNFDVDLGGVMGAGLLSAFRITFGDEGRFLWLELDPSMTGETSPGRAPAGSDPGVTPKPSGASPSNVAPKPESKGAAK